MESWRRWRGDRWLRHGPRGLGRLLSGERRRGDAGGCIYPAAAAPSGPIRIHSSCTTYTLSNESRSCTSFSPVVASFLLSSCFFPFPVFSASPPAKDMYHSSGSGPAVSVFSHTLSCRRFPSGGRSVDMFLVLFSLAHESCLAPGRTRPTPHHRTGIPQQTKARKRRRECMQHGPRSLCRRRPGGMRCDAMRGLVIKGLIPSGRADREPGSERDSTCTVYRKAIWGGCVGRSGVVHGGKSHR